MLREGCYRFYIVLRFRVERVNAYYFIKKQRTKFSVFKSIGYLWTGPKPTALFAVLLTSPSSLLKVPTIVSA